MAGRPIPTSGPILPTSGLATGSFSGTALALRLEARGFYTPGDPVGNGVTNALDFTGSAGLSVFLFGKGSGQAKPQPISQATKDSIIAAGGTLPPETPEPTRKVFVKSGVGWQRQWFWGAQAGVLSFNTDVDGFSAEPTFGGHWLITAKKTAMYVSYEQSFFLSDRHATITHPNGTIEPGNVAFDGVRRIMMGVLAFPVQKAVQPFGGVGFAIMEVLDPMATCTGCTAGDLAIVQNAADDAATKAFFWWMGGVDVRQGRLSLYGHYILTQAGPRVPHRGRHTHGAGRHPLQLRQLQGGHYREALIRDRDTHGESATRYRSGQSTPRVIPTRGVRTMCRRCGTGARTIRSTPRWSHTPFKSPVIPSATQRRAGPAHRIRSEVLPRRRRMVSSPPTGSRARIRTAAG